MAASILLNDRREKMLKVADFAGTVARLYAAKAAKEGAHFFFDSFFVREASKDARDAAVLMVHALSVKDIEYEGRNKDIAFAYACWDIFRKGYGLVREYPEGFYVYTNRRGTEMQTQTRLTLIRT